VAGGQFGAGRSYARPNRDETETLFGAGEVDALLIAPEGVTPGTGVMEARAALARRLPTLLFAPPSNLADLDALAALAARGGVPLGMPNWLRFLPATRALRDTVGRGEVGPLLSLFAAWRTRRPLVDPLGELGLPLLDAVQWCVPELEAIERVQVTAAPLFGADRPVALLILRARSGPVLTIEVAASLPAGHETDDEILIEVLGEGAALRAEPLNQAITVFGAGERRRVPWHRDAMHPLLEETIAALREGGELPGAPAELRPRLALIEELRSAAEGGEPRMVAATPPATGR
jgi:predicted dehydrogenase